jgi:hypothetical protein
LNVTQDERTKLEEEINSKTTEISSIINNDVNIFQLQEKIVAGFEKIFNIEYFINKLETSTH